MHGNPDGYIGNVILFFKMDFGNLHCTLYNYQKEAICINVKGGDTKCADLNNITRHRLFLCIKLRKINKKGLSVEMIGFISAFTVSIALWV